MSKDALVVVDMQKFFFIENQDVNERQLAEACNEIMKISRGAGIPVIQVVTLYREDKADWPKAWRADDSWCSNLVRDEDLSRVVDGIDAMPSDFAVEKKRFSAFYNTNLEDILRSLGCDHLYLVGYSADVCLRFTAVDAYNRGYGVSTVYEGIDSFKEAKDQSVEYLSWLIGADCISLEQFKKNAETR
ncbi:MAG TPA: cysteine hydrolase [Streptosporangiaceae bacterium]|nr:cysteine hydrolase [Streptosporangiaceae bacterium]